MIDAVTERAVQPQIKRRKRLPRLFRFYEANREPLNLWLSWRLALLLFPFLAGTLIPTIWVPQPTTPSEVWTERLLWGWTRWDGEWYGNIATKGYWSDEPVAFYPLFPFLMRVVGFVLTAGQSSQPAFKLAGLIIATIASFYLCLWLYRLARLEYDEQIARLTVTYLFLFPTAFFLVAVYTEGLFMALAVGAFYAARTNRWLLALILTVLAVLTKNQGMFLAVALLVEYGQQREWNWRKLDPKIFYFVLPALALAGWMLYNYLAFNNAFAFVTATQKYWFRYFSWPWTTLRSAFDGLNELDVNGVPLAFNQQDYTMRLFDLVVTVCFLLLVPVVILALRRNKLRLSYAVLFAFCLIQPLTAPRSISILTSFPRYYLVIFPAFFLLAMAGQRWPAFHRGYLFISVPLFGLLVARFVLGYWVA
jgi:hypothetical protein